jgi:hemoglobin-like flavoprotein
MTPKQAALIRSSWANLAPIQVQAAQLFYDRLFELDPKLRRMFKGDMAAQGKKLMALLDRVVNSLDNIATLVPTTQSLGRRHADYGVRDEHYDTVANALLWALKQGLGEAFTAEVEAAWVEAYTFLAQTMKDAANADTID